MSPEKTATRFSWIALSLSFLAPGVGHIYCGRVVKGLFLYAVRCLLPLLCIIAAFIQPSTGVLLFLILLPMIVTACIFLYSAIDAWIIAKRSGPEYELKEYNRTSIYWILIAMQFAYPVALTWGANEYVYEAFVIPTRSMSPNILAGDRVIVNKRPLSDDFPLRGDLVAFRTPPSEKARTWIGRVVGVAGDQIVTKGHEVIVNGKKLERERVPPEGVVAQRNQVTGDVYHEFLAGRQYRILCETKSKSDKDPVEEVSQGEASEADTSGADISVTVPDRSIFVMGDNRDRSRDSRFIGAIHVGDLVGYIDYIFYPAETWSRFGVYRD